MTYKSIVICAEHLESVSPMVEFVTDLVGKSQADVVCAHVIPSAIYFVGYGASVPAEVIVDIDKQHETLAKDIKAAFNTESGGIDSNITWHWSEHSSETIAGYQHYINHALVSDLVVVDQPPEWSPARDGLIQAVIKGSTTPIIVLPSSGSKLRKPRKVCIAWNNTRESSRAVKDSLPLLKTADSVQVVWVGDVPANELSPAADIGVYLNQHGIDAVIDQMPPKHRSAGDDLLEYADRNAVDLLVMGGFGHSMFHQLFFGAATAEVLKHMSIPIFLSH